MWHFLPIICWFTCVHSYYQRPTNNPYGSYEYPQAGLSPSTGPNPQAIPSEYYRPNYGLNGNNPKPDYSQSSPYQNSAQASPYMAGKDPRSPTYNNPYNGAVPLGYYLRSNSLRDPQSSQKADINYQTTDLFDLDYGSLNDGGDNSYTEPVPETRNNFEMPSYYEELELTEKFGNYLKKRTRIDASSTPNDAAHQYNALFAVIIALAKVIRNSCTDFDQIYDQIYLPTVETYYKYGLANGEKVAIMMQDYINKGNSHMPKIRKLKEDLCDSELFCAAKFDNYINNSPLLYVKELETLEALSHLARNFYPYIDEFNQAAQKGTVQQYLKNSKDKIKTYVMHVVNSVEHLTDRAVNCT